MFSNSAKYALKAVLYLALHADQSNRVMIKDMHAKINVPRAYLAKLMQALSKHDLVSSTRGPKGGFYLSEANMKEPLTKVIYVIDGKKRMESCLLSLKDCDRERPCPLHSMFVPARTKLTQSLEQKTIADLTEDLIAKKAFLPL